MDVVTYGLLSKRITSSLTGIGSVTPVPPNKLKFTNKKDGTDFTITLPMNMTQAQLDWLVKMFDKVVINDTTNDLEYNGIPLNNIVFGTVADFDGNMQKLYCNISENKLYRYNGSSYVAVGGESGASNFDYLIVEKYSKLGNSYTTSKIAYVQTDETISSVEYKKGFYEFDTTTTTWNYLEEQNNVHSNREVIDKFDESDVLDTDGITVLYKQPTFDSKELLFKTDIGDVNVYAYKTGTTYKKDDIVLSGAILYVALRDTQDTTQITEDDFVAISSNGSTIEDYISGTDYKVGDIVIYDNRLYKCKVEPQADNTTFDETEWIKLSISNDLEKFLADFTVVELKEDIFNPTLVTGYQLKFKGKQFVFTDDIKDSVLIIGKYSDLPSGLTSDTVAFVLSDEVVGIDTYEKGIYLYSVADTAWSRYVDNDNIEVLNKLSENDILDPTDGVTVIGKELSYNGDSVALKKDAIDTVPIHIYTSGTQYDKDTFVVHDKDIYKVVVAPQADPNVFDESEYEKISEGQIVQVDTMPTASVDNLGKIYQYVGTTTLLYTNGMFYRVVEDSLNAGTYLYEEIDFTKGFIDNFEIVELKEDISDPDLVTGYDLKFKNKELAYREEIKGDTDIYFYQTGVVFAKDSVVLKDNVFYIALRDTVDLVNFDDVADFAMIHKLPDTVEIYKYVSGTDYEIGQYVIKGNDIYECIALQADNTVFDDVNEFKLISNYVLDSKPLTMDDLVDSSVVIAVPYTGVTDKTVTSDYVYKTLSDIIPKLHVKTQDELYHEIYEYTTAYYELSSVGTDGALEIVADGTSPLTDTQIEESNVTPIKEGQTVAVGDYVILVESQKTNVTKFVPRSELDAVPTKDSENRLTSGSVYSSLYETKQRTVIDVPENYVACTSTDMGALEVIADDAIPTTTQVTLSVVQAFVPTAQVGEYYQHIDEVSHLEDYEDTIYREKDDSYSSIEVDEKIKEVNDKIMEIASGGLKTLSLTEYRSFMDNLVISADGYVAP